MHSLIWLFALFAYIITFGAANLMIVEAFVIITDVHSKLIEV